MKLDKKMVMTTPVYIVIGFFRNTAAKGYKDLEVGDFIQFSISLNQRTQYSLNVTIKCLNKGTEWVNSRGTFSRLIGILDLEEVKDEQLQY